MFRALRCSLRNWIEGKGSSVCMSWPPHIQPPLFSTSCTTAVLESQKLIHSHYHPKAVVDIWVIDFRLGWHLPMLMLSLRIVPLRLVLHFFIPPAPWSLAISIVWPSLLHKFVFTQNAAVSYRISSLCNIFILSLKVFITYAYIFLFLHSSLFLVLGNIPLLSTMK